MSDYQFLKLEREGAIAHLRLNRPEVHNAFDDSLVAELTRAALKAAEDGASDYGDGTWICDENPFIALRPTMPGWMVRVNDILKTIGSHNLLATPSEADFSDPDLAPLLGNYLRGADDHQAEERARLFRTAWDMAGSALGGRVELYERFYAPLETPVAMSGRLALAVALR